MSSVLGRKGPPHVAPHRQQTSWFPVPALRMAHVENCTGASLPTKPSSPDPPGFWQGLGSLPAPHQGALAPWFLDPQAMEVFTFPHGCLPTSLDSCFSNRCLYLCFTHHLRSESPQTELLGGGNAFQVQSLLRVLRSQLQMAPGRCLTFLSRQLIILKPV